MPPKISVNASLTRAAPAYMGRLWRMRHDSLPLPLACYLPAGKTTLPVAT